MEVSVWMFPRSLTLLLLHANIIKIIDLSHTSSRSLSEDNNFGNATELTVFFLRIRVESKSRILWLESESESRWMEISQLNSTRASLRLLWQTTTINIIGPTLASWTGSRGWSSRISAIIVYSKMNVRLHEVSPQIRNCKISLLILMVIVVCYGSLYAYSQQ